MNTLPFGCRFKPRDEELLYFLERKATNQPLPWEGGVVEKNLYENAPWEIFDSSDPWQWYKRERSMIYVFTRVVKIGPKNRVRKAGEGTWHGETGEFNIVGPILGSKRTFSYEVESSHDNLNNFKGRGHWTMHEYSLTTSDGNPVATTDYVICRITVDYSKELKVRPMKRSYEKTCLKDKAKRVKKRSYEHESFRQDTPQPIFEAVEPVIEAVAPTLAAVETAIGAVQPVLEAAEPIIDQMYSSRGQIVLQAQENMKFMDHQPFFSSSFSTMEPILDQQYLPSSFDVQEPILEAVEPVIQAVEPTLETTQPEVEPVQPIYEGAGRVFESVEQIFDSLEPIVDLQNPLLILDEDTFKLYEESPFGRSR